MFKFVVLFAVVALVAALPQGESNHHLQKQFPDGRIVGGESTTIEAHPYQAGVLFRKNIIGSFNFICGGIVIASKFVITAGHCTDIATMFSAYKVRLGSTYQNSGYQTIDVSKFHQHPQYNDQTLAYDLSVLELSTPLTYSATIWPATLPTAAWVAGTVVTVTGWGTLKEGDTTLPNNLQQVNVTLITNSECNGNYGAGEITNEMVCAGVAGKDSCQGDSGGPMVYNEDPANNVWVLIASVSWGNGCGQEGYPGVYADVFSMITWLHSIIDA